MTLESESEFRIAVVVFRSRVHLAFDVDGSQSCPNRLLLTRVLKQKP